MSFLPTDSAIKVSKSLDERISAATSSSEIQAILRDAAVEQKLVVRDAYDPNVLLEAPGAQKIGKTVVFNGKSYDLIADDAAGLLAQENELYRQAFESTTTTVNDQARDERGRFVERRQTDAERQAEAVRQSDLELRWKLGQITSDQYLSESGAIERHLASQGIDTDALKEVSDIRVARSWESATAEFLATSGASWPGGDANLKTLGELLQNSPELLADPSVESLSACFDYMKEHHLLVVNPDIARREQEDEQQRRIAEATSPEDLRAALGRSSSLFY